MRQELESQETQLAQLQDKLESLGAQYQTPETEALAKDLKVLKKKHDAALQKAGKVRSH